MASCTLVYRGNERYTLAWKSRAAGAVLLLLALFGCSRAETRRSTKPGPASTAEAQPLPDSGAANPPQSAHTLAPLEGAWLERVELPTGQVVLVAPPIGARSPRPVIMAIHGAFDRPDWACGGWRLATHAYAFVICPQGHPMPGDRFGWVSEHAILRSVDAALRAVRARYGSYVADVPAVYAGFSQGAEMAAHTLLRRGATFPLAVLAEGGYEPTSDGAFARQYRAAGGLRVRLLCGSPNCFAHARRVTRLFDAAAVESSAIGDASAGHNLNEPMQRALREAWPDFVRGRPGWEAYPPSQLSGPD